MNEKTGKVFERKQLKNKWDFMKKEWKLYDRLIRLEIGIGGTRSLIDASPEWWGEKIKVNKDFARFRGANLEIFESHYGPLFRDSVAVGDQTQTPLQFLNDNNLSNMEGKGDSDEMNLDDDEPLFTSFVERSSSKRKKNKDVANKRSTKSKASSFEEKHLIGHNKNLTIPEEVVLVMKFTKKFKLHVVQMMIICTWKRSEISLRKI